MTSYVPPIKNGASGWIGYVALSPRTQSGAFQSNPTLATGDVKISIDGGALANLGTLPAVTPASSKMVKITLSQAETNGDNLTIVFSDAAGAEWCDLVLNLQTVARQIDDLAFPNTSGRGIDVSAGGEVGLDWANIGSPTTAQNLSGTNIDVDQVVASVSGAVGSVTGSVGSVAAGGITAASFGAGAIDAAALAADAGTEIGTAVWASATRTLTAIDEDSTTLDLDATVRAAVGLAAANLDTQLDALPTAAENATAVLTTQMTESYAANGTAPTLAQGVFAMHQILMQHAISGTTWTAYKLDNVSVAFTVTLDSATAPTSARRT